MLIIRNYLSTAYNLQKHIFRLSGEDIIDDIQNNI